MAVLNQATAGSVVDITITAFLLDQFTLAPSMVPALFNQQGSSDYRERHQSMSGLEELTEKTELAEPAETIPLEQFTKDFLHTEYSRQVKIERKIIDDQRFNFFAQMGGKLGEAAMRKTEGLGAEVFTDAFAGSIHTTEGGLTLCNSAHLNAASGNSQSNTGTTTYGAAAIGTTRTSMRRFTGYRGERISVRPDLLLGPVNLEQAFWEDINSQWRTGDANSVANFYSGRLTAIAWDYLNADTNNWFLIDSQLMKQNLFWYWRIPLETFGDGNLMIGQRSVAAYYRASLGPTDWRWVFGHEVS
jgi:hypothetical protein